MIKVKGEAMGSDALPAAGGSPSGAFGVSRALERPLF
jgi:hypothetical protein